jgi:beta-glucosidase
VSSPGSVDAVVAAPVPRPDPPFVIATGIECAAPVGPGGDQHDRPRSTGHREQYLQDFRLVRELGLRYLRWGVPFHVVAADRRRHDWTWTDLAVDALAEEGIEPIANLLDVGLPDDVAGLADPTLPGRYLRYVEAFVSRYRWIRWYTPVNAPLVAALRSARLAGRNHRHADEAALARAMVTLADLSLGAMAVIRALRPDAVFLQGDACESYAPAVPEATPAAAFLDEQRYLGFDLVLGREPAGPVLAWLGQAGVREREIAALLRRPIRDGFVVGLHHHHGNERLVHPSGTVSSNSLPAGFASLARGYWARYRRPMWLAQTSREAGQAEQWLAEQWDATLALRAEGIRITGFCWDSLTDQVDWDVSLREYRGRVHPVGLADLDRNIRPVGHRYAQLAATVAAGRFEPMGPARRVA